MTQQNVKKFKTVLLALWEPGALEGGGTETEMKFRQKAFLLDESYPVYFQ